MPNRVASGLFYTNRTALHLVGRPRLLCVWVATATSLHKHRASGYLGSLASLARHREIPLLVPVGWHKFAASAHASECQQLVRATAWRRTPV